MKRYDLIIVGAGPAGLSAAVTAAKRGVSTAVFDENERPGGQLFKQIHKFFGSREHRAKIRGFHIGEQLLQEAREAGVHVHLNATVMGLYDKKEILVNEAGQSHHYKADAMILATGARENFIPFRGWTLPGVMGAGAAQTMVNIQGVTPGKRVLMVGSGNVGLVVSYQLIQAGMEVAAVIDAAPRIGGYGVHAAKLARLGVPFYLSHTIACAQGTDRVTGAVITEVDGSFRPVPGTEKHLDVDTICVAVGLSPMSQLSAMAGCEMTDKGGAVPRIDKYGETSIPGVYAAGDTAGIEEASSAMITGQIAGLAASRRLGYVDEEEFEKETARLSRSLDKLHEGMFSPQNKGRTDFDRTDEGYAFSQSLFRKGYLDDEEVKNYPGVSGSGKGVHPVIECAQNIPCDPCQDACRFGCIKVGETITRLPEVDAEAACTGCGLCVASCSGQAIFLVNEDYDDTHAAVTLPYEFLPYPAKGDRGIALGRDGQRVCEAEVLSLKLAPVMDKTALLTMLVPKDMAMRARFFRKEET